MDAVRTDQNVTACRVHMRTAAVEKVRGHSAFVLGERTKPAAGMDSLGAQPFKHSLIDHALEATALEGELRHVMAGIGPPLILPDLLAVTGEIKQFGGADRHLIEAVQQTNPDKLADRMRQNVDADAKLTDGVGLLEHLAI